MRAFGWRMWYCLKLMQSVYFWLTGLFAMTVILLTGYLEQLRIATMDMLTLQVLICVVLPLVTISIFAGLFAEDLEVHALGLISTYPLGRLSLLVERIVLGVLITVLLLLAYLVYIDLWLFDLDAQAYRRLLADALPIHAILATWSLLWSMLGRGVLAGLSAGIGYWLVEMVTKGLWTKSFFLFVPVWPFLFDPVAHRLFLFITPALWLGLTFLRFRGVCKQETASS